MPPQAQDGLAKNFTEEIFNPNDIVVSEGDDADRLYLIVKGRVEVVGSSVSGEIILGVIGPGEIFGEIALLSPGAKRTATVRAISELQTLSLKRTVFTELLQTYPKMRASFETSADLLLTSKFLKQASPFTTLNSRAIRELANRLKKISLPENSIVIKQGEKGDSCYLVRSGQVEISINKGGAGERVLAVLEEGAIFGEMALLTRNSRNATIRTVIPCSLLELCRDDLIAVMGQDIAVSGRMMELLSLRGRPCRVDDVIVTSRVTPDDTTIKILKNPKCHSYFQLSPEGLFVWERLDGQHTLRDIALDYLATFKSFAPHTIAEIIGRLSAAGFLADKKISSDVQEILSHVPFWKRILMGAKKVVSYRIVWKNVDKTFTTLYQKGFWLFYTWPAQIVMAAIAIAGVFVFAREHLDLPHTLSQFPDRTVFLILLIVSFLFSIFVHELGHAFTTKAFGREVLGVGIGLYWFGPMAFVDTSDMWLAPRWQRIAVTVAGPYTNLVLAGVASLAALFISNPSVQLGCWFFAVGSYLMVLINLNPLLEYDGYYVLIDILERPNLRSRSISWLVKGLPEALKSPQKFRGHVTELLYGTTSLLYIAMMIVLSVFFYRIVLQKWIAKIVPDWLASDLVWVLVFVVIAGCVLNFVGELISENRKHT